MRPVLVATLSAAMFLSTVSPACRGGVVETTRITLDEGNVTALLEVTSQHYVDAMRELIRERYRDEYRAIRWESLEDAMRREPVARLEYRFTRNGAPAIQVYHAMGGRPLSSVAKSIFEGSTPPGSPETPESLSDLETGDVADGVRPAGGTRSPRTSRTIGFSVASRASTCVHRCWLTTLPP